MSNAEIAVGKVLLKGSFPSQFNPISRFISLRQKDMERVAVHVVKHRSHSLKYLVQIET